MRVGLGFDTHGFDSARPLVLGGVTIPDAPGLAGHSDGDALCHAIADALLGAARLGDLGERWPSTEQWRGAASVELLEETMQLLRRAGWRIANIDSTVVAERPRLAPHRQAMVDRIARSLEIEPGAVSVKSTTTDGLGFTGRSEGIAAYAVVLISKVDE
ncbi:MAG: 2-C-methyl-D-erythritol 2,4-cyclodiphosphate synthase [Actinomycetota bacterium]|nr:2-C-methyl-D-erythritol 2,4-cyclodiphosphate synthase [Actinomycetota bacterium]